MSGIAVFGDCLRAQVRVAPSDYGSESSCLKLGNKRTSLVLYGISRVDDPEHRTHAWRVSLRRRGTVLVRNFPDKKWGSKRKALDAAKQHRDELVKKYPPLTRVEFANGRRKNNSSGVTGVCLVKSKYWLVDGRERQIWYWEAIWPTTPGKHTNKRFSVAELGHGRAFEMACEARRKGLKKVEGVFWPAERGLVEAKDTQRGRAPLVTPRKKPAPRKPR